MKPITALVDDETLMPFWVTDKEDVILKAKENISTIEPLQVRKVYSIDAEFGSYCIDRQGQEPIKGYFMKVPSMKSYVIESDETD